MLWTIFVILLVLWLLGFSFHIAGGLIHLLLVVALVVLVYNLMSAVEQPDVGRVQPSQDFSPNDVNRKGSVPMKKYFIASVLHTFVDLCSCRLEQARHDYPPAIGCRRHGRDHGSARQGHSGRSAERR